MSLTQLQNFLDNTAFAILLATMLVYWVHSLFPSLAFLRAIGTGGMTIANLAIATLLGARWLDAGYFPLSNLYESLFFVAWGITTIHLYVENGISQDFRGKHLVGAFTSPVAMGITAFAALSLPEDMQKAVPLVPALKSNWLMMHVSVILLSYGALMVGSVLAVAFLWVSRQEPVALQGDSLGVTSYRANDSLCATLDNLSYRAIGLGFLLLTVGIIAGAVWANEAWGTYWSWDPKETWSLIVWLVYASYLHMRLTKGCQGRKPALVASLGMISVWVCYLGVNLLGKGLHSYGWFF
ncbi:MAG: c-type cytochrome biogenesis protein CcsB [Pseudanabaenaceae cyanobacterium]